MFKAKNWDFNVWRGVAISLICLVAVIFLTKDFWAAIVVAGVTGFLVLLSHKPLVNILRKFLGRKSLED